MQFRRELARTVDLLIDSGLLLLHFLPQRHHLLRRLVQLAPRGGQLRLGVAALLLAGFRLFPQGGEILVFLFEGGVDLGDHLIAGGF